MEIIQQFGVRVADTDEKLEGARILLDDMFERRGYVVNQREEDHLNCLTFLSSDNDKILGTVSLCTGAYPAFDTFASEISRLQGRGARLCEICKLAFLPSTNSKAVFGALLHVVFLYARYRYQKTDAIIQVNPRHEGYYAKMLGFKAISDVRINSRVKAPARLLWLDLGQMKRRIDESVTAERDRSLYPYFFSPDVADRIRNRIAQGA